MGNEPLEHDKCPQKRVEFMRVSAFLCRQTMRISPGIAVAHLATDGTERAPPVEQVRTVVDAMRGSKAEYRFMTSPGGTIWIVAQWTMASVF